MNAPIPNVRFIRDDVQAMHAYAVQDATDMVKLDAMENPYALPLDLQAQLGERLGRVALNRYPGARIQALHAALAAYVDLPAGYALTLGNGSDELISMLAMACARPGACILGPEPGFVMYAMSAQLRLQVWRQGVGVFHGIELDHACGILHRIGVHSLHIVADKAQIGCWRVHALFPCKRISAARAWACKPSPCASTEAVWPSICAPASDTSIKLLRF